MDFLGVCIFGLVIVWLYFSFRRLFSRVDPNFIVHPSCLRKD